MNKLVKIFRNEKVMVAVKIDTDTAKILKEGETNAFQIDGGLIGVLDKVNNCVLVTTPEINVIRNSDFKAISSTLQNIQLNKKQTQELNNKKELKGVSFVEIQGVKWDLSVNEDGTIKAVSNYENKQLGYYTETNQPLNK